MTLRYKALNSSGAIVEDSIEVENRYEALSTLKGRGLTVIDMQEEAALTGGPKGTWKLEFFGISQTTVAFFTRQFAELIEAGIPLTECLRSLRKFSPNATFSQIVEDVEQDIQKGTSLSAALEKHPEAFNALYVSLIRVGESTGNLPTMIGRLADYMERDLDLRSKVKSALTYPTFILIFSLVLVWVMVAYLLPGFEPMWTSSGMDLNRYPITVMLMKLSSLTHSFWDELIVGTLSIAIFYGFLVYAHTPEGGRNVDAVALKIPVLGNFQLLTVNARVASTLGTMLEAGSSFLQALEMSAGVAGNRVVSEALLDVSKEVAMGQKLGKSFRKHEGVFPSLMVQMVELGEESGQLMTMMPRVSRYYQSQLDAAIKAFSSLIEPVMMVIVGGVVFIFVLGVMMPIMGIVTALQSHM